jgi:putative addiction module component (TIGR02574 family)
VVRDRIHGTADKYAACGRGMGNDGLVVCSKARYAFAGRSAVAKHSVHLTVSLIWRFMSRTKDEILTEAMTLDPRERDEVAYALWQSFVPGELSDAQLAEVHRRIDALDCGEAQPIPGEQVMRELQKRFQR